MQKGILITLEGVDGSGKTAVANALYNRLRQKNLNVIKTREPGGNKIAEQLRSIILDKNNADMSPLTEVLLYQAGRVEHMDKVIKPALKKGDIVICDRFIDSTIAYQYFGRKEEAGFTESDLNFMEELNIRCGCTPDLTFILDVSEKTAKERMNSRGETDRFDEESDKFRKMVRNGYMEIAIRNPERIKVINGETSVNNLVNKIMEYVNKVLKEE